MEAFKNKSKEDYAREKKLRLIHQTKANIDHFDGEFKVLMGFLAQRQSVGKYD